MGVCRNRVRRKEEHQSSLHCVCVAVCACTLFEELFLRHVVSGGAHMSSLHSVVSAVMERREEEEYVQTQSLRNTIQLGLMSFRAENTVTAW